MSRLHAMQHYTIPFEDLSATVDTKSVKSYFGQHAYHPGGWSDVPAKNILSQYDHLPCVNNTTHVIREVKLNDEGGLDISFEFINTPRGFTLMNQYYTNTFKMVPVTDKEGINIYRFDFIIEED